MDFVMFFPNVKTLTLINQGISEIEVRPPILHFIYIYITV